MSVTMARGDGVTVLTLTTDPESPCPPLCQILGHLCYNPLCCTVSQRVSQNIQGYSQTALGVSYSLKLFVYRCSDTVSSKSFPLHSASKLLQIQTFSHNSGSAHYRYIEAFPGKTLGDSQSATDGP